MRYPPDYKANARAKLLATAGALAKEKGFGTTGVDALMAAAGLTSGAFYSHFKSKPDLLKAILENELGRTADLFANKDSEGLRRAFRSYLNEKHVMNPAGGCPLPALTPEVARADNETRKVFEQQLIQAKQQMEPFLQHADDAWVVLSQAVGAVMLARALATEETRKELLSAVKNHLDTILSVKDLEKD